MTRFPRLVFVSPVLPYPCYSGGETYPYFLVKNLSQDFDIDFVCLKDPRKSHEPDVLQHMQQFCRLHLVDPPVKGFWQKAWDYPRAHYFKGFSSQYLQKIEELAEGAKFLHFDYLKSASYLLHMKLPARRPLISYFTHNYEPELFQKLLMQRQPLLSRGRNFVAFQEVKWRERKILESVDQFYAITRRDADLYQQHYQQTAAVTENGVDVESIEFRPTPEKQETIFIGNLLWGPNVIGLKWFLREGYDKEKMRLRVVGRAHEDTDLSYIERHPEIEIHRSPPTVLNFLYEAGVSIVPLLDGSGSRGKILESMAAGKPVISTAKGAEGLAIEEGKHYLRADRAEDFAREIQRVFSDKELYLRLAHAGREYVEKRHSWKAVADVYRAGFGSAKTIQSED